MAAERARLEGVFGKNTTAALALGEWLLASGRATEAEQLLQPLVAYQPDNAQALAALAQALLATGRDERGLAALAQALALEPSHPRIPAQLVHAFGAAGRADTADALLKQAAERHPELGHLRLARSRALVSLGLIPDALQELLLAARSSPSLVEVWKALVHLQLRLAGSFDAAIGSCRKLVELEPTPENHGNLAFALQRAGRDEEAREHVVLGLPWTRWAAAGHASTERRLRVGVLTAPGFVNTPTEFLVDRTGRLVETIPLLDGVGYPLAQVGRSYDVFFNAIADADGAASALRLADRLLAEMPVPVLNRPADVARTTRDQIAARLGDIPEAVVPVTRRVRRQALLRGEAAALLEEVGFPLLSRPIGSHGGDDVRKAADAEALRRHAEGDGTDELYLTRFVEYASADGVYRKYRVVFVGGTLFPYHLSVSAGWLNHYFRSDMSRSEGHRVEEAAFLNEPERHLGATAVAALRRIAERIDLDYFGVDFALHRDGRLVLFECNPVMLIMTPQTDVFRYRHEAALRIRNAFSALLQRRATQDRDGDRPTAEEPEARPALAVAGGGRGG